MRKSSVAVIVLNWNDAELLPSSVGSLLKQTESCDIIVVDNGSIDGSRQVIESFGSKVVALWNTENLGFAGGVNTGIRYALEHNYSHIGLLNNDAEADKNWVKNLLAAFHKNPKLGGATGAMLHKGDDTYDSTGDFYSHWGLAFPRGRGENAAGQYDNETAVTAVSGGASMFSAEFFNNVGLFDEDFFAYYEDVDLGLRGQLRGWKFEFVPAASVIHATGSTSGRIKGFTTRQAFKNLPWLLIKNVPGRILFSVYPRFMLAHFGFFVSAVSRGHLKYALQGSFASMLLIPKKIGQRIQIQRTKTITSRDFYSILVHDLPPNAYKLRRLRTKYRKLIG